jgi:hypothetical protein
MKESNMNIQLKQSEIEAALRLYVLAQGISLDGKYLNIDFTAGRKAGGLIADLTIDNAPVGIAIPGFTMSEDKSEVVGMVATATSTSGAEASQAPAADPVVTEAAAEVVEGVAESKDPAPSLFGG